MKKIVFIRDLNTHLCCTLCDGYFRDAHTVAECLHTFCKVCLYAEFDKKTLREAKSCPTCGIQLGLYPHEKVVFDRNLQAIVDKLFPEFAEEEKRLEAEAGGAAGGHNGSSSSAAVAVAVAVAVAARRITATSRVNRGARRGRARRCCFPRQPR